MKLPDYAVFSLAISGAVDEEDTRQRFFLLRQDIILDLRVIVTHEVHEVFNGQLGVAYHVFFMVVVNDQRDVEHRGTASRPLRGEELLDGVILVHDIVVHCVDADLVVVLVLLQQDLRVQLNEVRLEQLILIKREAILDSDILYVLGLL